GVAVNPFVPELSPINADKQLCLSPARMVEFSMSSSRQSTTRRWTQVQTAIEQATQLKLDVQSRTRIAKERIRLPRPDQHELRPGPARPAASLRMPDQRGQCRPTAWTPSRTAQGSHAVTVIDTHVTVQRDPAGPTSAADSDAPVVAQGGVGAKDRILVTANELFYHEGIRSEEHTSELQSRENLVCR